jgi:hypothetical protein
MAQGAPKQRENRFDARLYASQRPRFSGALTTVKDSKTNIHRLDVYRHKSRVF